MSFCFSFVNCWMLMKLNSLSLIKKVWILVYEYRVYELGVCGLPSAMGGAGLLGSGLD